MTRGRDAGWCLLLPRGLVEAAEDILAEHIPQRVPGRGCAACSHTWPCAVWLLAESILEAAVPPVCTEAADGQLTELLLEGNRARALHSPRL